MTILERIKDEAFYDAIGYSLPAEIMAEVMQRTPEFRDFQTKYKSGQLTDDELVTYVQELMQVFRRGEKFRFDLTLAFLVVALERINTSFVRTFITDLSRVRISEIQLGPQVARLCMARRAQMAENKSKVFRLRLVHNQAPVFVFKTRNTFGVAA